MRRDDLICGLLSLLAEPDEPAHRHALGDLLTERGWPTLAAVVSGVGLPEGVSVEWRFDYATGPDGLGWRVGGAYGRRYQRTGEIVYRLSRLLVFRWHVRFSSGAEWLSDANTPIDRILRDINDEFVASVPLPDMLPGVK